MKPFHHIVEARWRKSLRYILDEHPLNVLDLGCGAGHISSALRAHHVKIFGLDIDYARLGEARKKGILVAQTNLMGGLPVKSECFDAVFSGEIIEHLIDTDYFLGEIHRVLKRSGILVLTTPNLCNLENRLRILVGRYPIFVDYTSRGDNHLRAYNKRALLKQLEEKGFSLGAMTGSFMPPVSYSLAKGLTKRLMPVLSWMGDLFPSLALHLIVKAAKQGEVR